MAKARFDIPTQLPVAVTRPVYAGVGVTDRVVEALRGAVVDAQKRAHAVQQDVQKTVSGLDQQPQVLRHRATRAVSDGVDTLGKDAQARLRADCNVMAQPTVDRRHRRHDHHCDRPPVVRGRRDNEHRPPAALFVAGGRAEVRDHYVPPSDHGLNSGNSARASGSPSPAARSHSRPSARYPANDSGSSRARRS